MNCKDIARLLDESEISSLSPAAMAELEAHVAACVDCAGQCLASEQMAGFRGDVPPLPASLHEAARHLSDHCEATARERRTRRPVIIGSLLLLGAAATMFAPVPLSDTGAANS